MFIIDVAKVDGESMMPNLKTNQLVLYLKTTSIISRFDIIILKIDDNYYIKRVIGLSNEHIQYIDNKLYVNGVETDEKFLKTETTDFKLENISPYSVIPDDYYLVLGDNRVNSHDSRNYGLIHKSEIKGKVIFEN